MNRMMIALMLMMGAAPAFARTDAPPRAEMRRQFAEKKVEHLAGKLGLDAAATARLRASFLKHQEQLAPLRKDAGETRGLLKAALASPARDSRQIAQLTEQLTRDHQQMQTLRAQHLAELKQQLTPEQYAQVLVSRHHRHGHDGRRHRDFAPRKQSVE